MHLSINFVTAAWGVSESPILYSFTVAGLVVAAIGVVLVYGPRHLVMAPGSLRVRAMVMPGRRETGALP